MKPCISLAVLVLFFVSPAPSARSEEIPFSVVASGGGEMVSPGYAMLATIGDGSGYLEPAVPEAPFRMRLGYWHSPGPNVGSPTSVFLTGFVAERGEGEVLVRWRLEWATDDVEFHVWRDAGADGRIELTGEPVAGQSPFEFVDPSPPVSELTYWLQAVESDGETTWFGPLSVPAEILIYDLAPNRPNPFNPRTTLHFTLPGPTSVRLAVYDVKGRLVRVLMSGVQPEGRYSITWDGRDASGSGVASGVYFARLESTWGIQTRSLLLAR